MKTGTTHSAVPVWRVVIIEDSPEDRAEIRRLLLKGSERRYQFVGAETGVAGVRAVLDAPGGPPDCLVLDYTLPDADALEVLAAIVGPDGLTVCPVVVLTGAADERLGPAVLRAGAQDFIGKSWMMAESLTRAVENAAERWAMTRELKARTLELQASEAQLKLGVEVAGLGVNRIDYETDTVVLDPIAAALFGLAAGVPLPRSVIHATLHPDDKDEMVRRMHQSLDPTGEGTFSMEHRVVHPDGSVHWLSVKKQVIFVETAGIRRPVTSVLAAIDITDRKVGEEQLRASEQFNRSLMDGTADCIKVLDTDGRLVHMNTPGLCALEIEDFGSVCGQEWKAIWPADARGDIERSVTRAVGGEVSSFQAYFPTAKGTPKWWEITVSPVRDADGGQIVRLLAVSRDITERKRAEEQLRQFAAELSEADRRKDEFLATLAHELRNPLAPIRNGLELIKLASGRAATVEKARSMMERQVTQMVRLIDDLMDVSRISTGKLELRKERVPLASVLNSAVETSRPLIEKMGHELTITLPEQPLMVDADMTRLAQVFLNLLNNAAKYSDRGGRIQLNVERQGSDVVVTVKDTGIGLAADQLPHIFEMFTQVDRSLEKSQGGLGIGLTLVRRLVEMHGGTVGARSEGPGKGSEFVVRLPVVVDVSRPQESGGELEQPVKSSYRILVVDDNREGADSLSEILRIMGNDTRTAYDGRQGVDVARKFLPNVVLFDIGLPELNGYEACRRIREQPWGKNIVLIAVTGWGRDDDRRRSREAGFDHHLVKPVDPQALMKMVAGMVVG
jgi:PAS domain S-box-containing protein